MVLTVNIAWNIKQEIMNEKQEAIFEFLQQLVKIKKKQCIKYRKTDQPEKFRAVTHWYDDVIKEYKKLKDKYEK